MGIQGLSDSVDGSPMRSGAVNDATLTDKFLARLKLRLGQDDRLAAAAVRNIHACRKRSRNHSGQNQRGCNEGDIDGEEPNSGRQHAGGEIARVGAFQQQQARVRAKLFRQLAVTAIDTGDRSRSSLQQAIAESSRGNADIQAGASGNINVPGIQRGSQLHSSAADIRKVLLKRLDRLLGVVDEESGLGDDCTIHRDVASGYTLLGARSRRRNTMTNQQLIQTKLHPCTVISRADCSRPVPVGMLSESGPCEIDLDTIPGEGQTCVDGIVHRLNDGQHIRVWGDDVYLACRCTGRGRNRNGMDRAKDIQIARRAWFLRQRNGLGHSVADQTDNADGPISAIGNIRARSILQDRDRRRIAAHRHGGNDLAEIGTVIAIDVLADIDQGQRVRARVRYGKN